MMKIIIVGGTGLIGAKLVSCLRGAGHDVVAASPASGVNSVTGKGLAEAMRGAEVVVDVTNSPSPDGAAAMDFFRASGRSLVAAGNAAGVKHHIVLSIVGVDRLAGGYFRAKVAQEDLIRTSSIPFTIVRSTQFYEFIERILENSGCGETVRLPQAMLQPIAADDVVTVLADVALAQPLNDIIEIAGPEAIALAELASEFLSARELPRRIVADAQTLYFGSPLGECSLVAGPGARLATNTFADWLRRMIPAG